MPTIFMVPIATWFIGSARSLMVSRWTTFTVDSINIVRQGRIDGFRVIRSQRHRIVHAASCNLNDIEAVTNWTRFMSIESNDPEMLNISEIDRIGTHEFNVICLKPTESWIVVSNTLDRLSVSNVAIWNFHITFRRLYLQR